MSAGDVVPIRPDLAIAATMAEDATRERSGFTSVEQHLAHRLAQANEIAVSFAEQVGAPMHARYLEETISEVVGFLLALDRQKRPS